MKARTIVGLLQCLILALFSPFVFAEQETSPDQNPPQHDVALLQESTQEQTHPLFTQPELDQLLAPIALYPDSLLSQILMASTYPLEVVEAARWSKAHPELKGEDAVQAVALHSWDASVKSLVAFPQVLATMDEKLDWTERLGDAFLAQQKQVMDSVQHLRQKASAAGNLGSNEQMLVDQQGQSIIIEPANPQVVYVPYYDPNVVYGAWSWPAFQPVYWAPWPGYFYGPRYGLAFAWGFGVPIGPRWWFGAFNWPYRYVTFGTGVVWTHSPIHRRGVRYRDFALRQRFGRVSASAAIPLQFRGGQRAPFAFNGQNGFNHHSGLRGGFGIRPEIHGNIPGRFRVPGGHRSDFRGVSSSPSLSRGGRSHFDQRRSAAGNIARGMPERHFSSSGRAGFQGSAPRLQGSFHGGGFHNSVHGGGGRGSHRR